MKNLALFIICAASVYNIKAQELESILLASDDASKLTESYVNPAMKGLLYSLNSGWFSTGETHKKFGFDISLVASASFVPSSEEIFTFNSDDYNYLSLPNGESSLPTLMSNNASETVVEVQVPIQGTNTFKVAQFEMPGGISDDLPANAVPAPMIQAGIGLPLKTDIKLRYLPKLNFDDSIDASLIGLGLQHDLMQYFGPLDKLPLNVSVLAAFTNMDVSYQIEEQSNNNVYVTDGEALFELSAWTVQAIGSLDFKIVTLYGSLGYNNGTSSLKMKGTYTYSYDLEDSNGVGLGTITESLTDPINLDFEAEGLRGTLGARLNMAWFKIFADYTLQEYNTLTLGLAFSFR
jgi:hypothetical protein